MQHPKPGRRSQRPPHALPPDQDQRDRKEIWKASSIPVWFVLEDEKLYLLPVHGSNTQSYKNVLKNPQIRIDTRSAEAELRAKPITNAKGVKSVVRSSAKSTGPEMCYYSKFDTALVAELG